MALTTQEAFKFGFHARCVEEGLSPEETQVRIKLACEFQKHADGSQAAARLATEVPKFLMNLGLWGYPAAMLGGAGAGYMAANNPFTSPRIATAEERKEQELIQAYQRHADEARQATARRKRRASTRPAFSGPRLL
jgi:hypothetical protein